jgi:hypothetical protein
MAAFLLLYSDTPKLRVYMWFWFSNKEELNTTHTSLKQKKRRGYKEKRWNPPALLATYIFYVCKERIVLFLLNVLWMYTRAEQQFPDRPANRTRDRPPDLFSHFGGCCCFSLLSRFWLSASPLLFHFNYFMSFYLLIYSRDCTWLWIRLPVCVRCVAHFYDDTVDDSLSAFYLVTIETPL